MNALNHIGGIALTLAVASATAVAGTAHADQPCAAVDTDLTEARQQKFADLVARATSETLKPSDVEILNFLESGSWSAVYASTPVADDGMFFFVEGDSGKEFRDVWGGWADPADRAELVQWAEDLGAPENLATCFAHVVIDGMSSN